ncbi:MAG: helix-turn-helix transcriptional regulator [Tuberibacillus sp.]
MLKNRVKEYREKFYISQERLAEDLGVTRQTIISIEKGKYKPSIELAFALSRRFNCLIEDIFKWEDEN